MVRQNPFGNLFSQNDFSKFFENYQSSSFDMQSFMETQRKNIQALTDAQSLLVENMQAIAQRQSALLSEMVEDNAVIAREFMAEGTPEEKIVKNTDLFKKAYERSVRNMNALSEMVSQSSQDANEIINKRVKATLSEIKASMEKSSKPATKKAA